MDSAVDELLAEQLTDSLGGPNQAIGSCGVRKMVQAHALILNAR
jgi:hypothetical protein